MAGPPTLRRERTLDDYVERYEEARSGGRPADLAHFLPPLADPLHLAVLRELIRVDLEFGLGSGTPAPLDEYRRRFPDLFDDKASAQAVAFEEYRQRLQAGEHPSRADYQERFGVDASAWPAPEGGELSAGDLGATLRAYRNSRRPAGARAAAPSRPVPVGPSAEAARRAAASPAWPAAGDRLAGFVLTAELGRGAFGRVYLARQGDLADRPVALKVGRRRCSASRRTSPSSSTPTSCPIYSRPPRRPAPGRVHALLRRHHAGRRPQGLQARPALPRRRGGSW